jgi:hypothetical protein
MSALWPLTMNVTVVDELAGLGAVIRKAQAEDDIVQAAFKRLQQGETGQTGAALRNAKVAPELALKNTINAASLLLGAQLASVVRFALRTSPACRGHAGQGQNHAFQTSTSGRSSAHPSKTVFHLLAGIVYIPDQYTFP